MFCLSKRPVEQPASRHPKPPAGARGAARPVSGCVKLHVGGSTRRDGDWRETSPPGRFVRVSRCQLAHSMVSQLGRKPPRTPSQFRSCSYIIWIANGRLGSPVSVIPAKAGIHRSLNLEADGVRPVILELGRAFKGHRRAETSTPADRNLPDIARSKTSRALSGDWAAKSRTAHPAESTRRRDTARRPDAGP